MKLSYGLFLVFLAPLLTSCEQLGFEDPVAEKAREEAEGKAIGSACRQTGRALEDCYQANRRAPKAAIFTGWRDMDGYMRENKIEEIKPESATNPAPKTGLPLKSGVDVAEPEKQKSEAAATKPATATKPAETVPAKKGSSALSH